MTLYSSSLGHELEEGAPRTLLSNILFVHKIHQNCLSNLRDKVLAQFTEMATDCGKVEHQKPNGHLISPQSSQHLSRHAAYRQNSEMKFRAGLRVAAGHHIFVMEK